MSRPCDVAKLVVSIVVGVQLTRSVVIVLVSNMFFISWCSVWSVFSRSRIEMMNAIFVGRFAALVPSIFVLNIHSWFGSLAMFFSSVCFHLKRGVVSERAFLHSLESRYESEREAVPSPFLFSISFPCSSSPGVRFVPCSHLTCVLIEVDSVKFYEFILVTDRRPCFFMAKCPVRVLFLFRVLSLLKFIVLFTDLVVSPIVGFRWICCRSICFLVFALAIVFIPGFLFVLIGFVLVFYVSALIGFGVSMNSQGIQTVGRNPGSLVLLRLASLCSALFSGVFHVLHPGVRFLPSLNLRQNLERGNGFVAADSVKSRRRLLCVDPCTDLAEGSNLLNNLCKERGYRRNENRGSFMSCHEFRYESEPPFRFRRFFFDFFPKRCSSSRVHSLQESPWRAPTMSLIDLFLSNFTNAS